MRVSIALAALAACLLSAGCVQPQGSDSPTPVTSKVELSQVGLEYRWNLAMPLLPGERIVELTVLDENLYLTTDTNRILAVRADDGVFLWSFDMGASRLALHRPTHVKQMRLSRDRLTFEQAMYEPETVELEDFDAVILNSTSRIVVLDRAQGTLYRDIQLSRINVELAANAGGASNGYEFVYGTMDGKAMAIRLGPAVRDWKLGLGGSVTAPIVYHAGLFYAGDTEGQFSCINPGEDAEITWRVDLDGPVVAAFAVDDRGCFVPCRYSRLYGLDYATGRSLPGYPVVFNGDLVTPVQLGDSSLYQYVVDEGLFAIDILTAEKRWNLPQGRTVVAVNQGKVYTIDAEKNLQVVDEISGQVDSTMPLKGFARFAPTARHSLIWAITADGHAYCMQQIGTRRIGAER
ncbi:MAG: PQQ-binding-like beta-propeller repeat protein [Phycisphaerae bacterium]